LTQDDIPGRAGFSFVFQNRHVFALGAGAENRRSAPAYLRRRQQMPDSNANPEQPRIVREPPAGPVWLRVFACLGVVVVACGVKQFLTVLVSDTHWCSYLCPSLFPSDLFFSYPGLEYLFESQRWAQERTQGLADRLFADPWNLSTSILIAPVYEEVVFRGPMFIARGRIPPILWWSLGTAAAVLFALSHGRSGLALLPLTVLGICGLWLIATTGRFWPAVALHSLHNFFFTSALIYHSLFASD
jgi:membrane protease YdiL (CAAX protease family)